MSGRDPDGQRQGVHWPVRAGDLGGAVRPDRRENGIKHILTAPRSPTTTRKVERWHKTLRREFLDGRIFDSIGHAQTELDGWVEHSDHDRPHQGIGMVEPWERFRIATTEPVEPIDVPTDALDPAAAMGADLATRVVSRSGKISFAGARYPVAVRLAGERADVVCDGGLVRIHHRSAAVVTNARKHEASKQRAGLRRATRGNGRHRKVDSSGSISFAGASYRVASKYARRQVRVAVVGDRMFGGC